MHVDNTVKTNILRFHFNKYTYNLKKVKINFFILRTLYFVNRFLTFQTK